MILIIGAILIAATSVLVAAEGRAQEHKELRQAINFGFIIAFLTLVFVALLYLNR